MLLYQVINIISDQIANIHHGLFSKKWLTLLMTFTLTKHEEKSKNY